MSNLDTSIALFYTPTHKDQTTKPLLNSPNAFLSSK
jgi:hypothetical protein